MEGFSFEIVKKLGRARAGFLKTKNGVIATPYLIPVATRGHIIGLTSEDLKLLKLQAVLANTYHLHFKFDSDKIAKKGGLHKFIPFSGPIFTDSGGFQAFSLGLGKASGGRKIGFIPGERKETDPEKQFAKISDKGVKFTSVYDNSESFMGPKESMEIQSALGADVIMAFDECTSAFSDKEYIKESMERSHRWEELSLKYRDKGQALYGIVHGGWYKDLRIKSAKFVNSLGFDGIAIGGSLGKSKENMGEILDWVIPELDDRPRHMLGIGWVDDVFECVERGIDTFDCVEMTRIARHGELYISPSSGGNKENGFTIALSRGKYVGDSRYIDDKCKCPTCKEGYTRAELRKLYKAKDPEYNRLATLHNIWFMQDLMRQIRVSIINGRFSELKKKWLG